VAEKIGQLAFSLEPEKTVLTVSELTSGIKRLLNRQYDDVRVAGEISSVTTARSGHVYFTLKDAGAVLSCVLFAGTLRLLRFRPQDGLAVVARGSVDVYEPRGQYQLIVQGLEPQGYGALQLAFEQLKKKLETEGLFAAERKRALPKFPQRIGLVTSPAGAAIQDMITVLSRRWPGLRIRLYPTQVQGEGAVEGICAGLDYFSRSGWAEVVIVGRGGGSLEDLWSFNEEAVARAIAACSVPVVSAVGHETDFTIADFVADLRAPTPSAAAELVVADQAELTKRLEAMASRALRGVRFALSQARQRLTRQGIERASFLLHRRIGRSMQELDEADHRMRQRVSAALDQRRNKLDGLERRVRAQDPRIRLAQRRQRLESVDRRMAELTRARLVLLRGRLDPLRARLEALSPLQVLQRGYAVVQTPDGAVVRSPADAPAGEAILVRLLEGRLRARVEESPAGS
jgi:exodeoxyribonuclease VII large subunit